MALCAKALGLKVVRYDPHPLNGVHEAIGVERTKSLADLLACSVEGSCPG